jgi:cytidylate kinase
VIVGHAAQVILKNFPKTLSVLIYAPLATSVKRLMAEEGLRPNEAEKRIREFNRNREEYLRLYYGVRWLDPELYDLILNTEMLGIEGGTAVILEAVRAMERK